MPIEMPSQTHFRRARFGLEANTLTFTSPHTRNTQRVIRSPGIWRADFTLPRMHKNSPQARAWIAFFLQCDGRANSFNACDPDRRIPFGPATGSPLVNGAGQTGNTLLIDGCTPNVTGWMVTGDYFSLNGQMHQLIADANTNGSGEATLQFRAAMRRSPADGAALTVIGATCTMILESDADGMWDADVMGIYEEKTFSAVEVF